ncbi:UNVERIFIED_CONTAM: hypothetical protein FKN15_069968 [Acipenser sinensis]
MSTRCPPKCVPSADHFFSNCRLTKQPPRATASEDNTALGSLQASPQAPGQTTGFSVHNKERWTLNELSIPDLKKYYLAARYTRCNIGSPKMATLDGLTWKYSI